MGQDEGQLKSELQALLPFVNVAKAIWACRGDGGYLKGSKRGVAKK
jgi:hypothetical protein